MALAHSQRLLCGSWNSELQGNDPCCLQAQLDPGALTKPPGSLCSHSLVVFFHVSSPLQIFLQLFVSLLLLVSSVADRHPSLGNTDDSWHPWLLSQVTAPPAGWVEKSQGEIFGPVHVTCLPCDKGQSRRVLRLPTPPNHTKGTRKGTRFFKGKDVAIGNGQSQCHRRSQMPQSTAVAMGSAQRPSSYPRPPSL
ncbi:hypothetical protein I79_024661 [Cricetulus griseus]|uniref:Uncharacterized protein n=1 Tax=Cricetulus griseus TaxID=10029 RepID=G3IL97_CRIGR|nr:hypothetical protein I79_024661 [Cricetulus griseus]